MEDGGEDDEVEGTSGGAGSEKNIVEPRHWPVGWWSTSAESVIGVLMPMSGAIGRRDSIACAAAGVVEISRCQKLADACGGEAPSAYICPLQAAPRFLGKLP